MLTLKAYLDEAERDLINSNWKNLQIYIFTFAEQENAFALLIGSLKYKSINKIIKQNFISLFFF